MALSYIKLDENKYVKYIFKDFFGKGAYFSKVRKEYSYKLDKAIEKFEEYLGNIIEKSKLTPQEIYSALYHFAYYNNTSHIKQLFNNSRLEKKVNKLVEELVN